MAERHVWLLIKYYWETQDAIAAYETEEQARRVMADIQAVAKHHRVHEDTSHTLERNLGVKRVRLGHDLTFVEADGA